MSHLRHDVGALGEAGLAQPVVYPHRLLVLLQLEVGVGHEHLATPVVGQVELGQLVPGLDEAGQLQPRPPVGGPGADTVAQHRDGEIGQTLRLYFRQCKNI